MDLMLFKARCFNKYPLFILFLILSLVLTKGVEAAALYSPGETLNPSCLPTDTDCTVTPPVTISTATGSGLTVGSSGVEITDGGITFIKWASNSCINGQIPKFNGTAWVCGDDELGTVGLSTWVGSTNVTTLGTITTGVWHGSDVALGSYTSGNYVAGATTDEGLIMTGTEGGTLGIQLDGTTLSIGSSGLKIADGLVTNWDTAYGWGNHASAGYLTAGIGATLTSKTISGNNNNIVNISNSSLTNSGITVNPGAGLSGGGMVSLGGSISLALSNVGSSGTYGGASVIPVMVLDSQGRVTGVTETIISGLGTSNFYTANISQWVNNSGYLTAGVGATLTNKEISGFSNNIWGIENTALVHSQITINTGIGLSGGGNINLGETTVLRLSNVGTSGTYGGPLEFPVITVDGQGRITNAVGTTIAGITANNLAAGDFSSAINTGNYSINISGVASTSVSFSGALSGDVSGNQNSTTVIKINGATLGLTTATAGNLLIGSSSEWVSHPMSGDATISSTGGLTINYSTAQSADASHKGFLTAADWLTFNGKQDALGYTAENAANKSISTTLTVGGTSSDVLYPSQKAVKTYVDGLTVGLNWKEPLEFITVVANTTAPVTSPGNYEIYFIDTGGNTGDWSSFSAGDAVQYQTDHWVMVKHLAVGDRFGVGYKTPTTPYNAMAGKKYTLGQITGGTPGNFSYTFTTQQNNDAVYIKDGDVVYRNMAFTYSSDLAEWIQFSSSFDYSFASGFELVGVTLNLGNLTKDWNQNGAFNINTAGDINVYGGDIGTTATTASLFNTYASTLNIGGAASVINVGSTGGTTIAANGALTINSYNGATLTIDSATTGAVKMGTGNNAKAISIGNTNASTTLSINGGVIWSIGNSGDFTTTGNISTSNSGTITSVGLLTASNGLTVLSGGISLPAASIGNSLLANSSLTINAGVGLSGGGAISLGGTQGLAINLTTSGGVGSTASNSGLEVSSSGLTLLKGCSDGQILKYTDAGGWACATDTSGGSPSLNTLAAADGNNTINNGNNVQKWNWALTSADGIAFTFGESAAAINGGPYTQSIVNIGTTTGSTAAPLRVGARGSMIIDTTNVGGVILGSTVLNSAITLQSGSGTINIGTDAASKIINIGTTGGTTALNLFSGSGGINIGTESVTKTINIGTGEATNVVEIGSTTATSKVVIHTGSGGIEIGTAPISKTIYIGTGAAVNTLMIGSTNTTSSVNIQSGISGINIGTEAVAKTISIGSTTGTSTLNLFSGTGGVNIGTLAVGKTISIGTGAAVNTLVIGSTNTTSSTTIQSGSGNITFAVDGTNSSGKVIIGNSGTTAPDLLVLDNGTSDPTGTNGATYYNSSSGKFRCYENGAWKDCITSEVQKTRSFGDTSVTTFMDTNTNPVFIGATQPNITLSSASNKILVVISVGLSAAGTGNDTPIGTIRRSIGGTAVCDNARTGKIDSFFGNYTSDAVSYTVTNTYLDDPATSSTVYYTLCTDNTSVMADTVYKTAATITLIEVNNSNADLAEIYSTTDKTIGPGAVVTLDSNLKAGVKKSTRSYEKGLMGVVSSTPAITIGGVDDDETSAVPVALSGRVPVQVNTENGPIKAGDPLTSSSTPGVAMKATKAGVIIGIAMSDFEGDGTGQVLMFIKNGPGNGTKIADLLPGVDENAADFSKQILDELMWQKNNLVLTDLSEIITDRLVAGVEIITPKIVTDKTQTRNLCVGEEGNETCITKSQLDQLLSRFDIGNTEALVPTLIPTPTGIGATLDTTLLTE